MLNYARIRLFKNNLLLFADHPVKILKLCYEFPPIGGGGAQVVAALSHELARQGHHVELITMRFDKLPHIEIQNGVIIHRVPSIRLSASVCTPAEMLSYLIASLPVMLRLVKRNHFDINHTHFIYPDGILAYFLKKSRGLPYVITAHGSDVPGYNPDRFKFLHVGLLPIWKQVVANAEMIVSPSRSLAYLLRKQIPDLDITIIPNGAKAREYNFAGRDANRILVISRLFERKGVQYLLEALDGFTLPIAVNIVGDGPFLATLKEIAAQIQSKAKVHFHGWLDNDSMAFQNLLEQSSVFILPSEAENFPIVLLEAMSAELAIITTKGTGCEEVVGDAALLVDPRDPAGLQQALFKLTSDHNLTREMGIKARQRVERDFAWSNIVNRYTNIYRKIVDT